MKLVITSTHDEYRTLHQYWFSFFNHYLRCKVYFLDLSLKLAHFQSWDEETDCRVTSKSWTSQKGTSLKSEPYPNISSDIWRHFIIWGIILIKFFPHMRTDFSKWCHFESWRDFQGFLYQLVYKPTIIIGGKSTRDTHPPHMVAKLTPKMSS